MKKILFIFASFLLAGEMEVDGNLKVNGNIDANGNTINNVGAPQNLTDAVNAGILASALSDDGVYEYMFLYLKFSGSGETGGNEQRHVSYIVPTDMATGDLFWSEGGISKLNDLLQTGWKISARLNGFTGLDSIYIYELRKPLSDD